jgi:hypothetical protein
MKLVTKDEIVYHETKIIHEGFFRPKDRWFAVDGEEIALCLIPSFYWYGRINPFPLVWMVSSEKLMGGMGEIDLNLMGITSLEKLSGKQIGQAALVRYLSDVPLFPHAFLILPIEWREIDSKSLEATLNFKGINAQGIFHFDEAGLLMSFTTDNRFKDRTSESWIMKYKNYEWMSNRLIPIDTEASWNLQSGDFPYARFHIKEIHYK